MALLGSYTPQCSNSMDLYYIWSLSREKPHPCLLPSPHVQSQILWASKGSPRLLDCAPSNPRCRKSELSESDDVSLHSQDLLGYFKTVSSALRIKPKMLKAFSDC